MKKAHEEPVQFRTFVLKRGKIDCDGYKKIKSVKLGILVDSKDFYLCYFYGK